MVDTTADQGRIAAGEFPFRPDPPLVIGLLGGVAAGKSTAAAAFATRGLRHVDADRIARDVTATPALVARLAQVLGREVVGADGTLDRAAVAQRIFADQAKRRAVEAILHPPIRQAILAELAAARAAGTSVLLDVPLLLENGLIELCDVVVFVAASEASRIQRAQARGWTAAELAARQAAQLPLEQKRARADFCLDNDGPLDAVQRQIDDLLRRLGRPDRRPPAHPE